MLVTRLRQLMADVFDLEEDELPDEPIPGSPEPWDSLNHLRLITAIEEEFDITLRMDEVESVDSLTRLTEIVQAHTGSQ